MNLAHDIVTGRRSAADARKEYAHLYQAYRNGEKPAYAERFQFPLPKEDTRDPDEPMNA